MSKISVIIPVYNVEKFLRRCLNSVINQTMSDLEIILVDDGSNDNSGEICDEYAKNDARIIVIHKENGGVSSARNKGLDIATGEWITFVDSDDYIDTDMYEMLYSNAIEKEVDICACFFKYLTKDNIILFNPTKEQRSLKGRYKGKEFLKLFYMDNYTNGICVAMCNKIYKRNIFDKLRFKSKIYEDDEICHEIYLKDLHILLLDNPFYTYIQNINSLSNAKFSEENLVFIDILYNRLVSFKNNDLKALYKNTAKLYCNIVIEYYFKIKKLNNAYDFNYLNQYDEVLKDVITLNNISSKDKIRFYIFKLSPILYSILTNN
ncbi:glycosyltransferase family 2 protein [Terrisporobacter petrolearius]|uniref:glycosyltransferase family 2 protein n=1 Tax=Terrisporobacter petrolearius TaxID=1460447 RepID=UPI003B006E88